ncbi:hypothetical protein QQF64_034293 [Cirrhinus molitorella]|uniref:Uncharacterized protein n=1 Tax=Cirrhinus molitorella TaxID=172907 RepID=A0ABR3L245_9TELE
MGGGGYHRKFVGQLSKDVPPRRARDGPRLSDHQRRGPAPYPRRGGPLCMFCSENFQDLHGLILRQAIYWQDQPRTHVPFAPGGGREKGGGPPEPLLLLFPPPGRTGGKRCPGGRGDAGSESSGTRARPRGGASGVFPRGPPPPGRGGGPGQGGRPPGGLSGGLPGLPSRWTGVWGTGPRTRGVFLCGGLPRAGGGRAAPGGGGTLPPHPPRGAPGAPVPFDRCVRPGVYPPRTFGAEFGRLPQQKAAGGTTPLAAPRRAGGGTGPFVACPGSGGFLWPPAFVPIFSPSPKGRRPLGGPAPRRPLRRGGPSPPPLRGKAPRSGPARGHRRGGWITAPEDLWT